MKGSVGGEGTGGAVGVWTGERERYLAGCGVAGGGMVLGLITPLGYYIFPSTPSTHSQHRGADGPCFSRAVRMFYLSCPPPPPASPSKTRVSVNLRFGKYKPQRWGGEASHDGVFCTFDVCPSPRRLPSVWCMKEWTGARTTGLSIRLSVCCSVNHDIQHRKNNPDPPPSHLSISFANTRFAKPPHWPISKAHPKRPK
jgi:hypothetical protein